MRVKDVMTSEVVSCRPDDSLHHAAQLMWDNDLGCLPVGHGASGAQIDGVITDRDICMSAFLQRRPLLDMKVSDAMSRVVRTCRPTDTLQEAERIMCEFRVRRLPVIDEVGVLVGMISLADLAREAQLEEQLQKRQITSNNVGLALASICQRPRPAAPSRAPHIR
jgi:CBS-domain-containing membrane protein